MKLDLILGGKTSVPSRRVAPSQVTETRQLAGYVDAIEAPNEADCGPDVRWSTDLRAYGNSLRSALDASPSLHGVQLIGPSFCHQADIATYGTANDYDTANLHAYANGQPPEAKIEKAAVIASGTQGGRLPLVLTETGYATAPDSSSMFGAADEQVAADYLLRVILDSVRIGVRRVYLYELLDEKPDPGFTNREQHFGLVRADGTRKPGFYAIQRLLRDIAGGPPGAVRASSATGSFAPTVVHPDQGVRDVAVSDPDGGGGSLALWSTAPSAATLPAHRTETTITLPAAMTATARIPSRGNKAIPLGRSRTFQIGVGPAPTVVHFAAH